MPERVERSFVNELAAWMQPFRGTFTAPTWQHLLVLVMGAILVPGRRTVASALRVMDLDQIPHFTSYHRVLTVINGLDYGSRECRVLGYFLAARDVRS